MYTATVALALLLWTRALFVAGNANINTYTATDGRPYYTKSLNCTYTSLYMTNYYSNVRKAYTLPSSMECCYLYDSRHKCCAETDSKGNYQSCRCDPSVTCSIVATTTTAAPTTTTVPTTTTTLPPTTTTTVQPTKTTTSPSDIRQLTSTTTTTVPTTTTTVPSTTTTTVPTTTRTVPTTTTTVPSTRTTTVPTTTRTVPTTTTTVPSTTTTTVPTTTTTTVPTTTTTVPSTTTTTVPTTTTTVPTTTSTTKATTTTRATTRPTTTTKRTTTTTKRTTTTTKPTTTTRTTTTTTKPTTTTASKALCRSTYRLLNGEEASTDCANSAVFKITFSGDVDSSCNAVYTVATVNGVNKPTILTAEICKNMIKSITPNEDAMQIHIGSKTYNLVPPNFTVFSGSGGTAFLDVAQSQRSILDEVAACQEGKRCPYNKDTMEGRVDKNNCFIYSWGVSDAYQFSYNGLNEAALEINNGGCQNSTDPTIPNSMCFKTKSGKNLICGSDYGASVYCKAYETDEMVLFGVVGTQNHCDASPEVSVLPHPG